MVAVWRCERVSRMIETAVAMRPANAKSTIAVSEVMISIRRRTYARGVPTKRVPARYGNVTNQVAGATRFDCRMRCTFTCDTRRPSTAVTVKR